MYVQQLGIWKLLEIILNGRWFFDVQECMVRLHVKISLLRVPVGTEYTITLVMTSSEQFKYCLKDLILV